MLSHPILLHSNPNISSLCCTPQCLLHSNIAVHTHNTLHPATNQPNPCCNTKLQSLLMLGVSKSVAFCLQAHKNWVQCVSWSPDAAMVVSGDQNGVLWLWQPKTGETIGACRGTPPPPFFCCFLFACLSILVHLWRIIVTVR